MTRRERIGVAVLTALVALSVILALVLRGKPAPTSDPQPPFYKEIEALRDTTTPDQSTTKSPTNSDKPHKSGKSHKKKSGGKKSSTKPAKPKPKPKPRSPLDEPC